MWYFSWILGVLLACSLGIINVLRLEAQEALAKENEEHDSLTQLLAKESMMPRLQEKVENSKRNGLPFSLLYISLREFKIKHAMLEHEIDTTLIKVVDTIKKGIRNNVDIAARVGAEEFLLALPGAPLTRAEQIAEKIKDDIFKQVKTPDDVAVEANIGVAEYLKHADRDSNVSMTSMEDIEVLLNIAIEKSAKEDGIPELSLLNSNA